MVDATKARVAVTGAVSKGALGATAPTGTASMPTGFVDLGFMTEDGVEISLPDAGDTTPIAAWQGGTVVRVIRKPADGLPSWKFTMIEERISTIETYFGITVTPSTTEGTFKFVATATRPYNAYIIDAIDGANLIRDYVPRGIVASVESHSLVNSDLTVYGVTVEGELDATLAANFQRWSTSLKTGG